MRYRVKYRAIMLKRYMRYMRYLYIRAINKAKRYIMYVHDKVPWVRVIRFRVSSQLDF